MIVDFPAPVAPTMAMVSPALTLNEISLITLSPFLYENTTFLNEISPFILFILVNHYQKYDCPYPLKQKHVNRNHPHL